MKRLALRSLLALTTALVVIELALHLSPQLLPGSYLAHFPGNGTEFFHPGVFERTPVEGVLLPHLANAYHGPPPADLIEMGLAPPEADDDRRAFPEVRLPADELGFPNPARLERADVLLVGDSFGVAMGVRQPPGLALELERATGRSVYDLSLAGIGPVQERWLIESLGLGLEPRLVLWFFFSGNDLTTSFEPFLQRREGLSTWAQAYPERRKPRLILPDLLRRSLAPRPEPKVSRPLAPFRLAGPGTAEPAPRWWLHPDYLRQLAWSEAEWSAHPVWGAVQGELVRARDACAAAGARLALVYLPSKPEVLLPRLERDAALVRATVVALGAPAPLESPEAHLELLLANRRALEHVVGAFCSSADIPFFSALPALERAPGPSYLVTDSHWTTVGQAAVLPELLEFLRREGLLDD